MGYKKTKSYILTPSRKNLGKFVARKSRNSIAIHCWKDLIIRRYILKALHITLRREICAMCSNEADSLLKSQSSESLPGFKWHQLEAELSTHAPTLKSLLHACFSNKVARQNETYLVSFCAAMMFKQRRPSMSLLHKILSVILYSGHCSKQVHNFIIMSMVFITIIFFSFLCLSVVSMYM